MENGFDLHYRYQRVSPDCPPLSSAKKLGLKPTITTTATMCKEEGGSCSNNSNIENGRCISKDIITAFEGAKGVRYRPPSRTQDHHLHNSNLSHPSTGVGANGVPNSPPKAQAQTENNHHHEMPKRSETTSPNRGDVLLQWGQKKRARVSRSEIRPLADDSSSSTVPGRQPIGNKVPRRVLHATMPPPPPAPPSNSARCSTLRNSLLSSRNLDERSAAASGSPSRNSGGTSRAASRAMAGKKSPPLETIDRKKLCAGSVKNGQQNGSAVQTDRMNQTDYAPVQSERAGGAANSTASAAGVGEKVNVEVIEWPRIYISLSRKEKEEDFLAMKGTKLPQRPKKRAKNVDRTLQYCFPGMWLSDLTKSRYEVREKKSAKKQKRKGLKGMECVESDSE
ncbi:PREDICTED: uncharacterized protein LOC18606974 isoform X1 [Theobroma cacao]|uniref:Uncharacterized protein LOC18606974 isoform X1 n=1 Tax=Theobroma cacao TaxID=3641 RepID=A0AB32VUG0_THECC|nr:PREDICTED: uncharacterized protein LOC18606974 isoform X1 [Theobroma cacao]